MVVRIQAKGSPRSWLVGVQTDALTMTVRSQSSQKARSRTSTGPSCTTAWHMLIDTDTCSTDARSAPGIATLYIIARKWRHPECPLTVERIARCAYIQWNSPAARKKRSHEICREARKKKESAKMKTSISRSLNYMQMQKCIRGGWEDCSVVKSFSCPSRGFGYSFQYQH